MSVSRRVTVLCMFCLAPILAGVGGWFNDTAYAEDQLRVVSVSPNWAPNTGPVDLEITGSGFDDATDVFMCFSGDWQNLTATDIVVLDSTLLLCRVDLTEVPTGDWTTKLIRSDGAQAYQCAGSAGRFHVGDEPYSGLVFDSVMPTRVANDGPTVLTLRGSGFSEATRVYIRCCVNGQQGDVMRYGSDLQRISPAELRATFDLAGAPLGRRDIIVTDDVSWCMIRWWEARALEVIAPQPTVTGITPPSAPNTGPVDIQIAGTGFTEGAGVALSGWVDGWYDPSACAMVGGTDVVVVSDSLIRCRLDITGRAGGAHCLGVRNPDGQWGVGPRFTVIAPQVTGLAPTETTAGGAAFELTVTGSGFMEGSVVRWSGSDRASTFVSEMELRAQIAAEDVASAGVFDITVFNPPPAGGESNAVLFTVIAPPPTITGVTPSSGLNSGPLEVEVTGSGFRQGARVLVSGWADTFDPGPPCAPIWGADVVVESDSLIRCRLDITGAKPGQHCVIVGNPDNQWGGVSPGFEVIRGNPPPLTVSSISPPWAPNTAPVDMEITGSGFYGGVKVTMCSRGPELTATDVQVVSPELVRCRFDIRGQPLGDRCVWVTRADGRFGDWETGGFGGICASWDHAFYVGDGPSATPRITGVSPNPAFATGPVELTIFGEGFTDTPTTVGIGYHGTGHRWASSVRVVNSGEIRATLDLWQCTPGLWDVIVWDDRNMMILWRSDPNALVIEAPPPPPTVIGVTPSSGLNNGPLDVEITGSGFAQGARVLVSGWADTFDPGPPCTPIWGADVVVESDSLIRCRLDITGAKPGQHCVIVGNPGNQWGGLSPGLEVIKPNPVPQVTGLAPTETTAGDAAFELTVTGSGFMEGSVVRWSGSDRPTTFVSETELRAQIAAEDVASAGVFDIAVFNPPPAGGESNTVQFTVNNPLPAITSISPSWAVAGGAAFTLTVTGANFVADSVVQWNGAARPTTFGSDSQLGAGISAADIATGGTAGITVASPAPGGGASNSAEFVIRKPCVLAYNRDTSNVHGQPLTLQALLTSGGTAVEGILVSFRVTPSSGTGEWSYSATTDAAGLATVAVGANVIPVGTYTVACDSEAALGYHSASTSAALTVSKGGSKVDTYVVLDNGWWPATHGNSTLRFFFSRNAPAGWFEFTDRSQPSAVLVTAHTVTAVLVQGGKTATISGSTDSGAKFTLVVDATTDTVVKLAIDKKTLVKNQRLSSGDIRIYTE